MRQKRGIVWLLLVCLFASFSCAPLLTAVGEGAGDKVTLQAPVLQKFSVHPLGQPLTVKWATVAGATSYTAVITLPSGKQATGSVQNTTATFTVDDLPSKGKYALTVTALAGGADPAMVTRTFEVLPPLGAVVLQGVEKHTAGNDLALKWFSVAGATEYKIVVTPATGDEQTFTAATAEFTVPGESLSSPGFYRITVSATADGYYPSEATVTFTVEKTYSFGISGVSSTQGGDVERTGSYETAAYKAAVGDADTLGGSAIAEAAVESAREGRSLATMQVLLAGTLSLPEPWDDARYAAAYKAFYDDYATSVTAMLVDIACASSAITASEVIQIATSAVGGVLEMLLSVGLNMDVDARTALTAIHTRCKSVAASSTFGQLPEHQQEIIAMTLNRIITRDDQTGPVMDAALASLGNTEQDATNARALDIDRALIALYAEQFAQSLSELPDTASWAELSAAHELYQQYALSLIHLQQMVAQVGNSVDADAIADEIARFDAAQAAFDTLTEE